MRVTGITDGASLRALGSVGAGLALAATVVEDLPRAVGRLVALLDAPAGAGDLDRLLGAAAGLGLVGCLAYTALVLVLGGMAALPSVPGRAAARAFARVTPAALRRLLCLALGTGLALAPTAALADPRASASHAGVAATATPAPGRAVLPDVPLDRPAATPGRPAATPVGTATRTGASTEPPPTRPGTRSEGDHVDEQPVVVRRGDSLWRIAGRALGPEATDAEIAVAWPRWWVANRAVVGPDPDRLRPGQRLVPPPAQPVEEPR